MRMGQGVRTGLGHGGITCVLQTQFSSFPFTVPRRVISLLSQKSWHVPNQLSFLAVISPTAAWIFLLTFPLVTWTLCEIFSNCPKGQCSLV